MDALRAYQSELLLALFALVLVQFFVIWSLNSRVGRISRQFRRLMTGPTGEDLESLLHSSVAESGRTGMRCDELEVRLAQLGDKTQGCLQHIGLVRFDAFHDVAGQQSFSLAMLDGDHNGAIITALFGRQESRCFGKSVIAGHAQQALSEEEANALKMALHGGLGGYVGSRDGARNKRQRKIERQIEEESEDE
jgi:hypothetical protein